MAFHATLTQLQQILAATPVNLSETVLEAEAAGISTDTRTLKPGDLYLALRGENFDGHQFVAAAWEKGAIAAITEVGSPETGPQLQVADTLTAYQAIARWWRTQFAIPIIAVTGSVGKTTTKELIAAVLGRYGGVLKTQANYNNEIGVPKTLLELGPEHDYAVIEMGMRGPGEIACLAQIAQPQIALITNVGTAHIGRLGSREAIAQAKCELLAQMPKTSVAILNGDNPLLLETATKVWPGQTITYGLNQGDLRGQHNDQTLLVEGVQLPLPLPGAHNALNYLGALAVTKALHLDWSILATGLNLDLPRGRAQRFELPGEIVILDQTYNAGPESMAAALKLLVQTPAKRHIAVVGAMKELGDHSQACHQQIGVFAAQLNLDALLVLGTDLDTAEIAQGWSQAQASDSVTPSGASVSHPGLKQFATVAELVTCLQTLVQPGDCLLLKASHSVGLDQVVSQLRQDLSNPKLNRV